MRVLVTGSSSLLGRYTVAALLANGHQVTGFQRGRSGLLASQAQQVRGNIIDAGAISHAMRGQDAVIHLAAKVAPVGRLDEFERVNIEGTRNVIRAARNGGATRVVHVSTPSVAHSGSALVGVGSAPADPSTTRGHYATSKAKAELLALDAASADLAVVAIRPHLVWGPGDTQLVERIVVKQRSGRLAILGSGLALIDSIYVSNAADALVAALERAPHISGRALVISNGEPRTVRELLERILNSAGLDLPSRTVSPKLAFRIGQALEQLWDTAHLGGEPPMTSFLAEQLSTAHWFDQRESRHLLRWTPAVTLNQGFELLAKAT